MKVAVQLSGQQRYGDYLQILFHAMRVFDQIDIFAHHWAEPRSQQEVESLLRGIKTHPNAKIGKVEVEPQVDFEIKPHWKTHGHPIFNIMSMVYSIKQANLLRTTYEHEHGETYDLVIRARPDIGLFEFPQDQTWFSAIQEGVIYVGRRPFNIMSNPKAIQDQVAIARPSTMNIYSQLYSRLDDFFDEGNILGPEILFYWWLIEKNHFPINETGFNTQIDLRGFPSIDFRANRGKY